MNSKADRLLRWLCWAGIGCYFVISAFDIHRWRVDEWRAFDQGFTFMKGNIFGIPAQPVWLYAVAFPFIAVNFGCLVQLLRGRREGILKLFLISSGAIAIVPLAGLQTVIYRSTWAEILFLLGYAIGGAIAVILAFRLDSRSAAAIAAPEHKD